MKIAKITPLYKSGDVDKLCNYRPIILPVFFKIARAHYKLLYEKQFGFQQKCSTEYAILQLTKNSYEYFDTNTFTLGVFVDLSKAFDTVNHEILSKKLTEFKSVGLKVILKIENNS